MSRMKNKKTLVASIYSREITVNPTASSPFRKVHDRSAHAKLSRMGANLSYEKVHHKLQFVCILSKWTVALSNRCYPNYESSLAELSQFPPGGLLLSHFTVARLRTFAGYRTSRGVHSQNTQCIPKLQWGYAQENKALSQLWPFLFCSGIKILQNP